MRIASACWCRACMEEYHDTLRPHVLIGKRCLSIVPYRIHEESPPGSSARVVVVWQLIPVDNNFQEMPVDSTMYMCMYLHTCTCIFHSSVLTTLFYGKMWARTKTSHETMTGADKVINRAFQCLALNASRWHFNYEIQEFLPPGIWQPLADDDDDRTTI